jgi:hypothetical protein
MSERTGNYRAFFIESPEGAEFIVKLKELINTQHEHAEATDDPSIAFSYTQRAKGIREAISLISTLTTDAKKSKNNT